MNCPVVGEKTKYMQEISLCLQVACLYNNMQQFVLANVINNYYTVYTCTACVVLTCHRLTERQMSCVLHNELYSSLSAAAQILVLIMGQTFQQWSAADLEIVASTRLWGFCSGLQTGFMLDSDPVFKRLLMTAHIQSFNKCWGC